MHCLLTLFSLKDVFTVVDPGGALGASAPPPEPSMKQFSTHIFLFSCYFVRQRYLSTFVTKLPRELAVAHGETSVYSTLLLPV